MNPKLIIGNKNYSSWSMRPWLVLTHFKISFEEVRVPLYLEGFREKLARYTPAGKVPVLLHDEITCWDSLAICEYLADIYPNLGLWPTEIRDRTRARAISCEMHSGFFEVRNLLPMNCRANTRPASTTEELWGEIERICDIWKDLRKQNRSKGDFLFGPFTIADAMYAPVVSRFNTYNISVGEVEKTYMKNIMVLPAMQKWLQDARNEKEVISHYESKD